jgi:hypothetical protein
MLSQSGCAYRPYEEFWVYVICMMGKVHPGSTPVSQTSSLRHPNGLPFATLYP